jgi:hypothetical protein
MTRRLIVAMMLAAVLSLGAGPGDPEPRFIIDNRSTGRVEVLAWKYNGSYWDWRLVQRLESRTWIPIYGVRHGDRFRIMSADGKFDREVSLTFDKNYGGPQDIWQFYGPMRK